MKLLFSCLLLMLSNFLIGQSLTCSNGFDLSTQIQNDTSIYTVVDTYPEFYYKSITNTGNALEIFFCENYKMPQSLLDNGYHGRIIIRCVAEKDGSLTSVKIQRGIQKELDELVVALVKTMPLWTPAKHKGVNVRFEHVFPVDIRWLYGCK